MIKLQSLAYENIVGNRERNSMAENNRLTEKERNHDGIGISKQSLVVEHGMKKGMPSAYCEAIE